MSPTAPVVQPTRAGFTLCYSDVNASSNFCLQDGAYFLTKGFSRPKK